MGKAKLQEGQGVAAKAQRCSTGTQTLVVGSTGKIAVDKGSRLLGFEKATGFHYGLGRAQSTTDKVQDKEVTNAVGLRKSLNRVD